MAITWPSKDPDEVDSRLHDFSGLMDEGEEVVSYGLSLTSGTVSIDTPPNVAATDTTAAVILSGGADGETAIFEVEIVTDAGRTLNETIVMAVVSTAASALVITGHAAPTPANLIQAYPAFAAIAPGTIRYWLTRAAQSVDTSWVEADFPYAIMALAAHYMAEQGLGTGGQAAGMLAAGITGFKSGALDVRFSDKASTAAASGGFGSTSYGREFQMLVRRNRGGPRVTEPAAFPCYPLGYYG